MEHATNEIMGVYFLTPPKVEFEEVYARVRTKENRFLSDDLVKMLPVLPNGHPLENEWKKRAFSLRLFRRILEKSNSTHVLEIGCGNGWFANHIAELGYRVDALDVGKIELEQAVRCFQNEKLRFFCCDDLSLLENEGYETIVFNGSLHYFNLNKEFWTTLHKKLKESGRIFIIDTPIYEKKDVLTAKKRTKDYFHRLNEPKAASYYHHLTWEQLPSFRILYSPSILGRLFSKHSSPFPILQINKEL